MLKNNYESQEEWDFKGTFRQVEQEQQDYVDVPIVNKISMKNFINESFNTP